MELIAESELLDSLEIVEVNPILDRENETARLAVELAASAARRPNAVAWWPCVDAASRWGRST